MILSQFLHLPPSHSPLAATKFQGMVRVSVPPLVLETSMYTARGVGGGDTEHQDKHMTSLEPISLENLERKVMLCSYFLKNG